MEKTTQVPSEPIATKVILMELETLFTASKWDILQLLSENNYSPLELSERSNTSLANISQQLKLLEMAGLVTSKRLPNRDKGQPRLKYELKDDQSYLIATANNFVQKKMFKLSPYNKIILQIWFYDDPQIRYVLEKAFWQIEPHLKDIKTLGVHKAAKGEINFCIQGVPLSDTTIISPDGTTYKISFSDKGNCDNTHILYRQ